MSQYPYLLRTLEKSLYTKRATTTLPIIYASEDTKYKQLLIQFFENPKNESLHTKLIEDTKKSSAMDRTYEYANSLISKATDSLVNLKNNRSKESLELLAHFIIQRVS